MKTAEHQILTRIGFAERWLQRAREECLDGDVARGLLTLVLADAEVRRVLQLAVPTTSRPRSRLRPVAAMSAALIIAAVMALRLGVLALGATVPEAAGLAPGLRLRPGTGVLLEPSAAAVARGRPPAVAVPPSPGPASPAPARRTAVRPSVSPPRPAPVGRAASPALTVAPPVGRATPAPPPSLPAPVPAAAPVPVVAPAPAPTPVVSGVDLLDLVIVADRTLRRSQP